jgi:hypothetical protein
VRILDEYRAMVEDNPRFDPVRPVMFATVRRCERDESVPKIADRVTSRCADLFNVGYEILLQMFARYFAHTEETEAQLGTLADATVALMLQVLKPLGNLITTLPVGPDHPGFNAGPSFELFYESDYVMPHRRAAWALLEERVRDAANFCGLLQEIADERVVGELAPVGDALSDVANSLAGHFGDWGATSRFVAPARASPAIELPGARESVGFDRHIKPLFRERDRTSMKFAFDLWSYDDVRTHAQAILTQLKAGTMPCDGAWPAHWVEVFERWTAGGMAG